MRATQPRSAPFVDGLQAVDPRCHVPITARSRNADAHLLTGQHCGNGRLMMLQSLLAPFPAPVREPSREEVGEQQCIRGAAQRLGRRFHHLCGHATADVDSKAMNAKWECMFAAMPAWWLPQDSESDALLCSAKLCWALWHEC